MLVAAGIAGGLAGALNGCSSKAPYCTFVYEGDGPRGTVAVRGEVVATGLETPWAIAFLNDGAMLVTERKGRLRLVTRAGLEPNPVAVIPVHAENESGLLGIALAPSFATTRQFFLYYTYEANGRVANRIERWILASDAHSASPERVLVDTIAASPGHDGGRLRIGPDGMLYAGTGDARNRDLPPDVESLNGKILRMTVDGQVPPDNPWAGKFPFVRGVRNVEGFDWLDARTGTAARAGAPDPLLVVADHGPSGELGRKGNDEITVTLAGANLGWPDKYGCEDGDGVSAPSLAWAKAVPPGGAAFYTGTRIPEWRGSLMVGVLGAKHLHRVVLSSPIDLTRCRTPACAPTIDRHETYFLGEPPDGFGRLRDVVMGPDDELYVTTSNCDGRGTCPPDGDKILRITR